MTSLIVFALVLAPQTVTFTHPCAHSAVVLAALGEELNLTLKPSGSVNKDYFLVRFKDVPVQQAFDMVAETLNARWTKRGDVTYLGRTRAQEIEDFDSEYSWQKAAIDALIESMDLSELTVDRARMLSLQTRDFKDTGDNDAWAKFQPIAQQLPGNRALLRLIKLIDLDEVVRATGTPVTYSTADEGKPFPRGSRAVLAQMAREWGVFSEQSTRSGLAGDNRFTSTYQRFAATSPVLTEHLQLSAHLVDTGVLFMLSFLAEGRWQNIGYVRVDYSAGDDIPKWVGALEGELDLSAGERASIAPSTYQASSAVLQQALLFGSESDVALSAPSAAIIQASEEMGVSVVAVVPDSSYAVMADSQLLESPKLSQVLTRILTERSMVFELSDGWLAGRSARPYSDRRERMDRAAFSRMYKFAADRGSLPLDAFAEFVAGTVEDAPIAIADHLLGRALEMRFGLPSLGIERFRVYGQLTPAERGAARSGGFTLTGRPDTRRFVTSMSGLIALSMEADTTKVPVMKRPFNEFQEAMALLSADDTWTISARDGSFVQPYATGRKVGSWGSFMDARNFATNMVMAERRSSRVLNYGLLAPVSGTTILLRIKRTGFAMTGVGGYVDPLGKSVFGSFNDLPAELRSRLQKEIDSERKRSSDGRGR